MYDKQWHKILKKTWVVGFRVHVQWDTAVVSLHWIVHFYYSGDCGFVNTALNMDWEKSTLLGQVSPYTSHTKKYFEF